MEKPIKTYMAHFRTAYQISPDSTTIGEIAEWYKKAIHNPNADVRFGVSQSDSVPHLNGKG